MIKQDVNHVKVVLILQVTVLVLPVQRGTTQLELVRFNVSVVLVVLKLMQPKLVVNYVCLVNILLMMVNANHVHQMNLLH